ncbi:MAG: hypothetical protein IPH03_14580 [Tetrasphaera sp.]|nr:hypothetical protein [Tetrasphaera sp.]
MSAPVPREPDGSDLDPDLATPGRGGAVLFGLIWLGGFGMLQWSVVRFRVVIVLTLTVAAMLLALWLIRRSRFALSPTAAAVALSGSAPIAVLVPLWSYLPAGTERALCVVFAVAAVTCAVLIRIRRSPALIWGSALATYLVAGAVAIRTDPHPRIDVWVTLQQAADALAHGRNFYSVIWVDSPGVKDAFTYLPWSAVLLSPGRLLAGDVRWMLLVWVIVAAVGMWLLGRDRAPATAAAASALILLAPGTLTQIDQAWTEPLLLAGLVWWAVLMVRGHAWWSILPLALACASKQHLAAVLLVLLVWRPFGWRRALATAGLTGALIAPWALTAPADFVHDTITFLVTFHPIKFANTWYLLALNEFGVTLPFWATGLVVGTTLAVALWAVNRRSPQIGEVVRWAALVLFVANLVNKQAFYNQYWLVGALVALSLLLDRTPVIPPPAGTDPTPAARGPRRRSRD